MTEAIHHDLVRNHWLEGYQSLIEKMEPDDPRIENLGAQVLTGWATYTNLSAAHTDDECPFRDSDRLLMRSAG